jgi:hypothetical protein
LAGFGLSLKKRPVISLFANQVLQLINVDSGVIKYGGHSVEIIDGQPHLKD